MNRLKGCLPFGVFIFLVFSFIAFVAYTHAVSEINVYEYNELWQMAHRPATRQFRSKIEEAMEDDYVSHWEYRGIMQAYKELQIQEAREALKE